MKKIALTAAVLLAAAGSAFAAGGGSGHFGGQINDPYAAPVDSAYTSSIVVKHATRTQQENTQHQRASDVQPQFRH